MFSGFVFNSSNSFVFDNLDRICRSNRLGKPFAKDKTAEKLNVFDTCLPFYNIWGCRSVGL